MLDLAFVVLICGSFAGLVGYVLLCEKL
ncbi:hypothetical protein WCLP8_2340008 [uncultured Gammaproteobacteria bacterium]